MFFATLFICAFLVTIIINIVKAKNERRNK